MSKEKQIEEMAETMRHSCEKECWRNKYGEFDCEYCEAELLYNAGYRKQEDGEWEIVKGSNGKEKMVCTNCRHQQDLASTFTYCPNCGARMGGGE